MREKGPDNSKELKSSKKNGPRETRFIRVLQTFGVEISVETNDEDMLEEIFERLKLVLPNGFQIVGAGNAPHRFGVIRTRRGGLTLLKNEEKVTSGRSKEVFLRFLDSKIRLTVAEFASSRVFLHAGVVGWKGLGIIIPAGSFQGKTTLVEALTREGAEYYSDEYAVLDENGLVYPFPKTLSVRGIVDKYLQSEVPVESFGGKVGSEPIPVGMVLLTHYREGAKFRPRALSCGRGVLEMLSHTVPIRYNPELSLKVLNKTANRAIIVKTKRGEAQSVAIQVLNFFEDMAF